MKTLTAFYDLAIGPVSFDFVPFLIRAEMAREDARCDRLHVVIVPDQNGVDGMFRDKRNLYDEHEMHWRLWNLVVPACQLAGASVTIATDWDHAKRLATPACFPPAWAHQTLKDKQYLPRPIIEAARCGRSIPRLRASAAAKRAVAQWSTDKPLATITIRQTYEAVRNSDRAAYGAIEEALRRRYRVVWIEDTSVALARGEGLPSVSLDLRMACYELARVNVIGNNGPAQLLWFSDAPFVEFDAAAPLKYWRQFWIDHIGLDVDAGEQLPWARPDQRFVYGPPSLDAIEPLI